MAVSNYIPIFMIALQLDSEEDFPEDCEDDNDEFDAHVPY